MTLLRIGTRGSELALIQTHLVCDLLKTADSSLSFEEVVIKTHGDRATEQPFDIHWPAGGFVGAIEQALLRGEIDLAVHSYKDLPTAEMPGLVVAAVPPREAAHDVLITRESITLDRVPAGFRVGTGSPRRAAQLRHFLGDVQVVPLRGNVPTRLAKLRGPDLDGVVLAAAGLRRLKITPPHAIELPVERFVPAPGQGALVVQARAADSAAATVAAIDHPSSRRAVEAERAFLRAIGAGCRTPVGALAVVEGATLRLHGQLFSDDASRMSDGIECGGDPRSVGEALARRLVRELQTFPSK